MESAQTVFFSENFAPALMLIIIAVGVFPFVYLGIEADSYKKLLDKEAYRNDAQTYGRISKCWC